MLVLDPQKYGRLVPLAQYMDMLDDDINLAMYGPQELGTLIESDMNKLRDLYNDYKKKLDKQEVKA